jgi:hypothetical protein
MKNKILLPLILIFFVACDYPFFAVQEENKPEVVISAFFCPDSLVRVKIEPVVDAFTDSAATLVVEAVKLTNTKTGQTFFLQKEDNSETIYSTTEMPPALGDVLKIEVQTNASEEPVVAVDSIAETLVPFRVADTGVMVIDNSSGNSFSCEIRRSVKIRFLPLSDEEPVYLEILAFVSDYDDFLGLDGTSERQSTLRSTNSFITSEDYYPSSTAMDVYYPRSLPFKCPAGPDSLTVDFLYNTGKMLFADDGVEDNAHDLRIELRRVSKAYYQYKTALYNQENAIRGDIIYGGSPPVLVPANVGNGAGVFAGYNSTSFTSYFEKYTYQQ